MLSSTFQKLSKASEKKLVLLAIVTFLLAGSCMLHFDVLLKNNVAPLGIVSFELANTLDCSKQILNSWTTTEGAMQSAEWSLWFDYIFIITYTFLVCLIIHRVRRVVWKLPEHFGFRLGTMLINMMIVAGILDMIENFALLQLFYGNLQSYWTTLAFVAATIKFVNILLGILYVMISLMIAGIKKITHVKK